jgi:hypothetical protein
VQLPEQPGAVTAYDPVTRTAVTFMDIGPELAALIDDRYNLENRGVRTRLVGAYGDDMEHDRWIFNGDVIRFGYTYDDDGNMVPLLFDGQHRIKSIARGSKTLRVLVVRGLPVEARTTIDGQAKRNLGDHMKFGGRDLSGANVRNLMAVTRWCANWHQADLTGEVKYRLPNKMVLRALTDQEIIAFWDDHAPEMRHATRRGLDLWNALGRRVTPKCAGLVFWLTTGVDEDEAMRFFDLLCDPDGDGIKGSPVGALRQRALSITPTSEVDWLYLLLKAWILWRHDWVLKAGRGLQLPRGRQAQGGEMSAEAIPDPAKVLPPQKQEDDANTV